MGRIQKRAQGESSLLLAIAGDGGIPSSPIMLCDEACSIRDWVFSPSQASGTSALFKSPTGVRKYSNS